MADAEVEEVGEVGVVALELPFDFEVPATGAPLVVLEVHAASTMTDALSRAPDATGRQRFGRRELVLITLPRYAMGRPDTQ
ncbi:MAG: hypothetical protein M3O28_00970 [Actinomycetota bacterium]|nr:hypothetical protein [Actinomycetota bacterium]